MDRVECFGNRLFNIIVCFWSIGLCGCNSFVRQVAMVAARRDD